MCIFMYFLKGSYYPIYEFEMLSLSMNVFKENFCFNVYPNSILVFQYNHV